MGALDVGERVRAFCGDAGVFGAGDGGGFIVVYRHTAFGDGREGKHVGRECVGGGSYGVDRFINELGDDDAVAGDVHEESAGGIGVVPDRVFVIFRDDCGGVVGGGDHGDDEESERLCLCDVQRVGVGGEFCGGVCSVWAGGSFAGAVAEESGATGGNVSGVRG